MYLDTFQISPHLSVCLFSSKQTWKIREKDKWLKTPPPAQKNKVHIVRVEVKMLSYKQPKSHSVLIKGGSMKCVQHPYFVPLNPGHSSNSLRTTVDARLMPHTMIINLEMLSWFPVAFGPI